MDELQLNFFNGFTRTHAFAYATNKKIFGLMLFPVGIRIVHAMCDGRHFHNRMRNAGAMRNSNYFIDKAINIVWGNRKIFTTNCDLCNMQPINCCRCNYAQVFSIVLPAFVCRNNFFSM